MEELEEEIELSIVKMELSEGDAYVIYISMLGEELVIKKSFETLTGAEKYSKNFLERMLELFHEGTAIRTEEERGDLN